MIKAVVLLLLSSILTNEVLSQATHETLTEINGTIQSPNYDDNYPNDTVNTWLIRLQEGWKIQFVVEDMSIEDGKDCRYKNSYPKINVLSR